MSSPAFGRLVWKEYRSQRALWIVLAVVGLAWQLLAWPFVDSSPGGKNAEWQIIFAAAIIPLMFALGSSVLLFAHENEERTRNLLRTFPISQGSLFFAKFGIPLVATLLLSVVAWVPALVILSANFPNINISSDPLEHAPSGQICLIWIFVALAIFAWGGFYSLLTGRVMATVLLAPITVVALSPLPKAVGAAIVASVFVADFWLTGRWLSDEPLPLVSRFRRRRRTRAVPGRFLFVGESAAPWKRSFSRMIWLEWQQRRTIFRLLFFVGIAVVVVGLFVGSGDRNANGFLILYLMAVPYLVGLWTFHPEQVEHRHRIGAQRGLTGESTWLSKQLVWLPTALELSFVLLLFDAGLHAIGHRMYRTLIHDNTVWQTATTVFGRRFGYSPHDSAESARVVLQWIALAYACGQFMSLFFRRFVTAALVGILPLLCFCFIWSVARETFEIPFIWSVGWIVVVLMFATLVRTSDWMLDRNSWRRYLKIACLIAVPALAVFLGFVAHRVYEIPSVAQSQAMQALATRPNHYSNSRDVSGSAITSYASVAEKPGPDGNIDADPSVKILAANLLKVRSDGWMADAPNGTAFEHYDTIIKNAFSLTTAGDLDGAFVQVVRAIRVHWKDESPDGELMLRSGEPILSVFEVLNIWMNHPQQTSARLRFALRILNQELVAKTNMRMAMIATAEKRRKLLARDWKRPTTIRSELGSRGGSLRFERLVFPWEKERMDRMIEAVTLARLRDMAELERLMATDSVDIGAWFHDLEYDQVPRRPGVPDSENQDLPYIAETAPWKWMTNSRAPLFDYVEPLNYGAHLFSMGTVVKKECQRRGILIVCALVAFRRDHGKLPERLDALVPNYLASVPVDLWTGREFNYRREGFPHPLNGVASSPGTPVVWSSGPHGGRAVIVRGQVPNATAPTPVVVLEDRFDLQLRQPSGYFVYGLTFPVR